MVVLSRDSNPFHEFGKAIWLLGLVLPQRGRMLLSGWWVLLDGLFWVS